MGGGSYVPNFLYETPDAASMIFTEDDYTRRNAAATPDESVRKLLFPIWRIRSLYRDSLIPVQNNILELQYFQPLIIDGTNAIENGCYNHPGINLIIIEAARAVHVYTNYWTRLRSLKSRIEYVFQAYAKHAKQMVDAFLENLDPTNIYGEDYTHRILCSMQMCVLLKNALEDSMATGREVLNCCFGNLQDMAQCYFTFKIPLPHVNETAYSIMHLYWKQFEKEEKERVEAAQKCQMEEQVQKARSKVSKVTSKSKSKAKKITDGAVARRNKILRQKSSTMLATAEIMKE